MLYYLSFFRLSTPAKVNDIVDDDDSNSSDQYVQLKSAPNHDG